MPEGACTCERTPNTLEVMPEGARVALESCHRAWGTCERNALESCQRARGTCERTPNALELAGRIDAFHERKSRVMSMVRDESCFLFFPSKTAKLKRMGGSHARAGTARQCGWDGQQTCLGAQYLGWCKCSSRARRRTACSMQAPISATRAGGRHRRREHERKHKQPVPGRDTGRHGLTHRGLSHGKGRVRKNGMGGLVPGSAHVGQCAQTRTVTHTSRPAGLLLAITVFSCMIATSKSQMNNVVDAPEIISLVANDPDDLDGAAAAILLRTGFCGSRLRLYAPACP